MYDETNVAQTLFKADAPYIYDGKGNYVFSLRSLAIIFNKIAAENQVKKEPEVVPEPPKPAPPKPAPRVRPIDWGKASALYRAGWSTKAIAEEVGATEAVIGMYFSTRENGR